MIRRGAAVGAALSGMLHLLMLSHGHHLGWGLAMAAMAIVCLPCAGHLWRVESRRSWSLIAGMNAAMLGAHLWMLRPTIPGPLAPEGAGITGAPALVVGHSHGAAPGTAPGAVQSAPAAETLHELLLPLASGVAMIEILLALVGLTLLRRHRVDEQSAPEVGAPAVGAGEVQRRTAAGLLLGREDQASASS